MVVHLLRQDDAAGLGHAFEARGDVNPVAVDVAALDNAIAQGKTDSQLQPACLCGASVARGELALGLDDALQH